MSGTPFFPPLQTACNGWRFFDRLGISFKKSASKNSVQAAEQDRQREGC
jgi:hypothetical protein